MSRFEVMTRLSNGSKKPIPVGKIITIDDEDEANDLVALKAIRPVAGEVAEKGDKPVGTAQRAKAAETAEKDLGFFTAREAMRTALDKNTVKDLDAIIEAEKVEIEGSPNKPEKIDAIVTSRSAKMLGTLNRGQLLDLAAASGYADAAALEVAEDAAEDEIRAALMRVAAAQAD